MTEEEAIGRARDAADEKGWLWVEPVEATPGRRAGRRVWEVCTNAGGVGYSVFVVIDDETGRVVHGGENATR